MYIKMYNYTCLYYKFGVAPCRDQQNFKIPHNFTISTCCFDETSAVNFLQNRVCVKIPSSHLEKGILYNSRILPSHLPSFFLFAFKNVTLQLVILLISYNIDKIHTK